MCVLDGGLTSPHPFFSIPNVLRRVELSLFKVQFDELLRGVEDNVKLYQSAISGIKGNKRLNQIFVLVLNMGNYMNAGTKKGDNYGFQLSTLKGLRGTKSADNKSSLLTFLIQTVQAKYPDAGKFVDDLASCKAALRVESSFLETGVRQLEAKFRVLDGQLQKSANADKSQDRFVPVMEQFAKSGKARFDALKKDFEDVMEVIRETTLYLCEDPKKTPPEAFFALFAEFADLYSSAENELAKAAEAAAKAAEREKNKLTSPTKRAQPPAKVALGAGVVDQVVGQLKQSNASDIAAAIRRRREARGRNATLSKSANAA